MRLGVSLCVTEPIHFGHRLGPFVSEVSLKGKSIRLLLAQRYACFEPWPLV